MQTEGHKNILGVILVLIILFGVIFAFLKKGAPVAQSLGILQGSVLLGPTCPVVRNPPDPACDDKPFATRLVVTTADQSKVIKEFSSDANGKFSVEVPPGEYAIRSAAAANILPYCASNGTAEVAANTVTTLDVFCDSGIR